MSPSTNEQDSSSPAAPQSSDAPSKVALVTGASSGIGRESSIALARAGWAVVLAARRRAELSEAAAECEKHGGKVLAVVCDLTDQTEVKNLFAAIAQEFGRLDVLFNNAGTSAPSMPIENLTLAQFRQVLDVNVIGSFLCTQEAFRIMKAQNPKGGRIINNGSMSAHAPRPNSSPYTMSKHAILGLTKCTALDGRPYNIACSQIDVGNANTSMGGRMGHGVPQADGSVKVESTFDPRHVADAVVHMASLPLGVNVLNMTIMATDMPFVGRG